MEGIILISNRREKRVGTKIGDIFSVTIDEKKKKYFQLIAFDLTQLNSDVIRTFKKQYPLDATPDLNEVTKGEVEFYAHCATKWGVKLGYWEKNGIIYELKPFNPRAMKAGQKQLNI